MANAPLQFPDDREASYQLRVVRTQAGVVRALLDELDRVHSDSSTGPIIAEQLIDELTRLGCRALEMAATLAHAEQVPIPPASGASPSPRAELPHNVKALVVVR